MKKTKEQIIISKDDLEEMVGLLNNYERGEVLRILYYKIFKNKEPWNWDNLGSREQNIYNNIVKQNA